MYIEELSKEQLIAVKRAYLEWLNSGYDDAPYGDVEDADKVISDEEICNCHAFTKFSPEDFLVTYIN